jgi:membrane-anchored glycerophosphoryl diester phosphodiesterase (GDPDase)
VLLCVPVLSGGSAVFLQQSVIFAESVMGDQAISMMLFFMLMSPVHHIVTSTACARRFRLPC